MIDRTSTNAILFAFRSPYQCPSPSPPHLIEIANLFVFRTFTCDTIWTSVNRGGSSKRTMLEGAQGYKRLLFPRTSLMDEPIFRCMFLFFKLAYVYF